jgi:phosphatidylserine synthase 2
MFSCLCSRRFRSAGGTTFVTVIYLGWMCSDQGVWQWIMDVLVCNWLGAWLGASTARSAGTAVSRSFTGMKAAQYLQVKVRAELSALFAAKHAFQHYTWRGRPRGLRARTKRMFGQLTPHDFTSFEWHGTADFVHYVIVVMLLAVFLAAELNPFYLKVGTFNVCYLHRFLRN